MIGCLVAIDQGQGIGYKDQMPWPRLSADLNWFRQTTLNNCVVMGSNTWKSLPASVRPLPNRINAVVSSVHHEYANHVFADPVVAVQELNQQYPDKDIFIIGGQKIYDSIMNLVDVFYITQIQEHYTCDRFFDFDFVKNHYTNVKLITEFDATDSIPSYSIKEYTR